MSTLTIHPLNCATMCPHGAVRTGIIDRDPGRIVTTCLLIEAPDGLILIDTGFGAADIAAAGGISSEGRLAGFQPIAYAGHDAGAALDGAELVFAVGPAYSNAPFGAACAPHVRPGATYIVCPGSCAGALVFKDALGLAPEDDSVTVAETSTLPYAVRITGPATITVYHRLADGYYLAAIPARRTDEVLGLGASKRRFPRGVSHPATVFG